MRCALWRLSLSSSPTAEHHLSLQHDAWKQLAKVVGESSAPMLSCEVGVSEYGDKDNLDLAARFGIMIGQFPQLRLWTKGAASDAEPIKYTGVMQSEPLLRFVQEKAGVWIGLPGQVLHFMRATQTRCRAGERCLRLGGHAGIRPRTRRPTPPRHHHRRLHRRPRRRRCRPHPYTRHPPPLLLQVRELDVLAKQFTGAADKAAIVAKAEALGLADDTAK